MLPQLWFPRSCDAIQQSTAVRTVLLHFLRLPADISTFVDIASSIKVLYLWNCDMAQAEEEQGARNLAAATAAQHTTSKLCNLTSWTILYVIPILQGLRSNISLKTLHLGGKSFSDVTTPAIQQLLESTVSIQTFGLSGVRFQNNGNTLRTIARSLIQSRIVSALEFKSCKFRDEGSAAQFRSILQNKQNLTSLCLDNCSFIGGEVHETIVSTLSRPDSRLRSFELKEHSIDRALPNGQFRNLLRAIEKSKLERFDIRSIQSLQQLRALADSIPLMRIKKLHIVFAGDFDGGNPKPLLFQAIKNNFSLRSVHGDRDGGSIFDANDKTRLVFYAKRNRRLDRWVDKPEKVDDRKVWPEALKLAEQAGPNSLFCGLRSVLGGDYVNLRAGRKRKRPQYYAPS